VSASRFNYLRTPKNSGFDFTKIGWSAAFNTELPSALRTPPTPDVLGMADNVMASQGQSYIVDHDTQYWFSPTLTIVKGRHTIELGLQYEITLDDYAQSNIVSALWDSADPTHRTTASRQTPTKSNWPLRITFWDGRRTQATWATTSLAMPLFPTWWQESRI